MKYYVIETASSMFRDENSDNKQTRVVKSSEKEVYAKGDFVIVENKDYGIFLGKIDREINPDDEYVRHNNERGSNYKIVKSVDMSDYLNAIKNEKRKEELAIEMENKFVELDKIKKFQFYAELDPTFKEMFEEYKKLG